jgi:hypothetical protein
MMLASSANDLFFHAAFRGRQFIPVDTLHMAVPRVKTCLGGASVEVLDSHSNE